MAVDQKTLIDKYLHGELTEAEQEALEERFFADDDFFEQIETSDMMLIDRFVRREMDSEGAARFESGYLTSPERQEKAAKAALFHKELGKLKGKRTGWLSGLSSIFYLRMPVLQLAGAATAILLTIGIVWTFYVFQNTASQVAQGNQNTIEPPPVNTNPRGNVKTPGNDSRRIVSARLIPAKAVGAQPETVPITIGDETEFLNLKLPVPNEFEGESFFVIVSKEAGRRVAAFENARPRHTRTGRVISVNLRTRNLTHGKHRVSVNTKADFPESVTYGFDLGREP